MSRTRDGAALRVVIPVMVLAILVGGVGVASAQTGEDTSWYGEYFAQRYLVGEPALIRYDEEINFSWQQTAPAPGMPADNFAVRWSRFVTFAQGNYTFTVSTDDGVRLYIDDVPIISDWQEHAPTTHTATVTLGPGRYAVRMEYFDAGGSATARLNWITASSAPATSPTPVPTNTPAGPAATPTAAPSTAAPTVAANETPAAKGGEMPGTGGEVVYEVRPGDTLGRIAARFGVTVDAIRRANPWITNADRIFIGQRIVIPRAGTSAPVFNQVQMYLVSMGTGNVGCGDELVPVRRSIAPTTAPLTAALELLLSNHSQYYGASGLYNALYQSQLHVESIARQGSDWTVRLAGTLTLGGVCDNPRVQEQLTRTAKQFTTVGSVRFLVNGTPLEQLLSGR